MMGRTQDRVRGRRRPGAVAAVGPWQLWFAPLLVAALIAMAGCAAAPDQRTPWHQYLHDHGLE